DVSTITLRNLVKKLSMQSLFHHRPFDKQSGDRAIGSSGHVITSPDHPIIRSPDFSSPCLRGESVVYSIEILRSSLKSLNILPVPSTTLASGSSAIETGNPVSSRMRLSKF